MRIEIIKNIEIEEKEKITEKLNPFVVWPGGKRQLLKYIFPLFPKNYNRYIEAFLGGGAVFFNLQPSKAIINDANEELINAYLAIKSNPEELIELLKEHGKSNSKDYYYKIRSLDRNINFSSLSSIERAARFIYISKSCFNGLIRFNKKGQINSSFGYKSEITFDYENIRKISKFLNENNDVEIINGDYKEVFKRLNSGDFVYLDPPYFPVSATAELVHYTKEDFTTEKQIELKNECDKLTQRGVKFLLSNADCDFIRDLWKDYEILTVETKRMICSSPSKRGPVNEVLVKNY
uniref:Site-specific DNA-methyltransferase (adenine-specific) n=1 Tax=Mycoplasma anserisalpingitidis TaxID=519450 RepID=A0A8F2IHV9_9MOLU|nr:DNA adenine methylase [Mycoplasma anserisalpingitidis]